MAVIQTAPIYMASIEDVKPLISNVVVNILSMSLGVGRRPGSAVFSFPFAEAGDHIWSTRKRVILYRNDEVIFIGSTVQVREKINSGENSVIIYAKDIRHELDGIIIGQYGFGPSSDSVWQAFGGWPVVGYDIVFNKDNKGNRVAVDPPPTEPEKEVYELGDRYDGEFWTYRQILVFLDFWFDWKNRLDIDHIEFVGEDADPVLPFDKEAPEVDVRGLSLLSAINKVVGMAGGTWTINYSGTIDLTTGAEITPAAATLRLLNEDISFPSRERKLVADSSSKAYTPGWWTYDEIEISSNIEKCYDRVEVHTARALVERCLFSSATDAASNGTTQGLVADTSAVYGANKYVTAFRPNRGTYAASKLGENTVAGTKYRKWHRGLVTRVDGSGYVAAESTTDSGTRLKAIDHIWISVDATNFFLVKSGVDIDYKDMILKVGYRVKIYGQTKDKTQTLTFKDTDASTINVRFTVATELDHGVISHNEEDATLLNPRTRVVKRSDLRQEYRAKSLLQKLGESNPHTVEVLGDVTDREIYTNVSGKVLAMRDSVLQAANKQDFNMTARLPFSPVVHVGDVLDMVGLDLGFSSVDGDIRVTDVSYNIETRDTTITASNNLDGLQ